MIKYKAEFLKKRAEEFLSGANHHLSRENWELAAFNLEQSCQLFLKYSLFKELGDYPKVHSLSELLRELGKVYPQKKAAIEKIRREKASVIGDLDQAYITSRYLPVKFNQFQTRNMLQFTKSLIQFLKKKL